MIKLFIVVFSVLLLCLVDNFLKRLERAWFEIKIADSVFCIQGLCEIARNLSEICFRLNWSSFEDDKGFSFRGILKKRMMFDV